MVSREHIRAWDAEAERYDEPADHGLGDPAVRAAWRTLLLDLLPEPPARVADLGCGTGTLSVLLAGAGFAVAGVDFSPGMLMRANVKAAGSPVLGFVRGDASDPPLASAAWDAVLCRHVLWAMPDPLEALGRWVKLLSPAGRLVLVEGSWSTGAGLTAEQTLDLVRGAGRQARLVRLDDPAYWGRETWDERYVVVS